MFGYISKRAHEADIRARDIKLAAYRKDVAQTGEALTQAKASNAILVRQNGHLEAERDAARIERDTAQRERDALEAELAPLRAGKAKRIANLAAANARRRAEAQGARG